MIGRKRWAAAAVAVALCGSPAALARRPPARSGPSSKPPDRETEQDTPIDVFEEMSPEEQQRALNRLPPEQRQRLQERLQRFHQLPEEQQRALRNLYNRLHQLAPKQQESVRKAIYRFSEQAPDRQQALRDELRAMAGLSEQDRKTRMAGQEFRQNFSRREQGILRDMTPLLPDR